MGATVLGGLFGRKLRSVCNVGRATTAARGAGRASRERDDVARAQANLETLRRQLGDLESEFEEVLETTSPPRASVASSQPRAIG